MSMRDPPDGDGWNEDPSNEDPSGSIGIHRMRMAHDGHDGWAWDGMGKWRSAFTGNIWMGMGMGPWMGMDLAPYLACVGRSCGMDRMGWGWDVFFVCEKKLKKNFAYFRKCIIFPLLT